MLLVSDAGGCFPGICWNFTGLRLPGEAAKTARHDQSLLGGSAHEPEAPAVPGYCQALALMSYECQKTLSCIGPKVIVDKSWIRLSSIRSLSMF